jgi:hypothetical protein
MQHFFDKINAMIESHHEYESRHPDAGDAYAHLASEGAFDYDNGENRLAEYCAEHGIDLSGVDIDRLAESVIFWGYMTPGTDYDAKRRFLVSSHHVGEIECQVDSVDIGARFTPYLIDKLNRKTDAYWRRESDDMAYFYINCDSYWDHVCDKQTIIDLVEDSRK